MTMEMFQAPTRTWSCSFEDSELAQKHGLSSCSFQSFSRTAPIHHFYDSELWLSTWKDEPEMYEAPDMVLFF